MKNEGLLIQTMTVSTQMLSHDYVPSNVITKNLCAMNKEKVSHSIACIITHLVLAYTT